MVTDESVTADPTSQSLQYILLNLIILVYSAYFAKAYPTQLFVSVISIFYCRPLPYLDF
jgi:hypothetical protein